MVTLGKAAGAAGALLLGAAPLVEAVVQRGRSYIYTTALPPLLAEATSAALARLSDADCAARRRHLRTMSLRLRRALVAAGILRGVAATAAAEPHSGGGADALPPTPIVPVLLGADTRALEVAAALRRAGLWVPAIRPPTVPAGTARLRASLSAGHTEHDIDRLITVLKESFSNG